VIIGNNTYYSFADEGLIKDFIKEFQNFFSRGKGR
jgi:hypothetical protein